MQTTATSHRIAPARVGGGDPSLADLQRSVVVVIPAYNDETSLPLVLRDLPAAARVIVVDNGSSDRTGEVARRRGAKVVREERRGPARG
ncbi:MAG: glycosyltransferase, partial [Planctomycetes bacterium]|nr:glycosyltransferase [Planctomycetota bacterium]